MAKIKLYLYLILLSVSMGGFSSCSDEEIILEQSDKSAVFNPDIPEDIRDGYFITFDINLDAMGVNGTSLTRADQGTDNPYLREIEDFVDLEKLRILFFTCTNLSNDIKTNSTTGRTYHTGEHDYFLFESKSRWVQLLSDAESTTARWQVTAPVFTYGNNDEYDWESIRWALTNRPFKIVILANRPDKVNFGDFDSKFGMTIEFDTDRGPNWGPADSWLPENKRGSNYKTPPTINGLHHCQWDPVYTSKNSGVKGTAGTNAGVYNMIMENPSGATITNPKKNLADTATNRMGALSYWTLNNTYFHPNRTQGIPMYGVQVFDAIGSDWNPGTPYNVSISSTGQAGTYNAKNIHLLRSLVKLEFRIPKHLDNNIDVTVSGPDLRYSNVMSRCEPLDVSTPTEDLWPDHSSCEWYDIRDYGPIIINNLQNTVTQFEQREAWFYGAWKEWWHYNNKKSSLENYFNDKSPRVFNPVMQRNGNAKLDDCLVADDTYWYYVVYTGERNINDPSNFGDLSPSGSEVAFLAFSATLKRGNTTVSSGAYRIALTDYSENTLIKSTAETYEDRLQNYKVVMAQATRNLPEGKPTYSGNWNWPLLRNHVYTFTVSSFGNYKDTSGYNGMVIDSENREAPKYVFE